MSPYRGLQSVNKLHLRLTLAGAAVGLASCLWAGCSPGASIAKKVEPPSSPYVGAQACAECHQAIFERQAASHHALTLRAAAGGPLPGAANGAATKKDQQTNLDYRIVSEGANHRQVVSRNGQEVASAGLDYLLGSGHHGISPMSFNGAEWRYLSLTYYAKGGWDFSPMHGLGDATARQKNATGWPVTTAELEKCFGCHATRLAFQGPALDPTRTEIGVRCETCHGPGRAHVDAVRGKSADLSVQNPGKWSVDSYMALCQQCHNETATLEGTMMGISDDPASKSTVKYHVYGISRSRCFTASKGAFRCTSCHDPHGDTETQPMFYEAKCLSCHGGATKPQTICPVNAKDGCLTCHMPQVQVEKHTLFADHWIRARSPFVPKSKQLRTKSRHAAALNGGTHLPR
jgi:hypothetical protein